MNSILTRAEAAWTSASALRARRRRFKRYTFGDQWGDPVRTPDGRTVSERALVTSLNHHPATNNIIRQLVKSVVGYYRSRRTGGDTPAALIETDARTFEEFLVSGCALQCTGPGGVRRVSPARFFINTLATFPSDLVEMIGELHDFPLTRIVMRHAHGSRQRAERIRRLYERDRFSGHAPAPAPLGESDTDSLTFAKAPEGLCRLIEVWTLETCERLRCHDTHTGEFYYARAGQERAVAAENRRRRKLRHGAVDTRWDMTARWHCRFFTPSGEVIDEFEADCHPYVYAFYPLLDGEVHPFVEDVIEQQRNINRLLTLNDRILATAAKGVLLFPENQAARDMSLDEAVDNWTSPDGVVLYRAVAGLPGPQQVVSSPGNLGIGTMVEQQLRLIEEVSGVSGAMRGLSGGGADNGAYYDRRRESAELALADIFDTFDAFTAQRDALLLAAG